MSGTDWKQHAEALADLAGTLIAMADSNPFCTVGFFVEHVFPEARKHVAAFGVAAGSGTTIPPCAGTNCGSTDGRLHSAECFAEHDAVIADAAAGEEAPKPLQQTAGRAEREQFIGVYQRLNLEFQEDRLPTPDELDELWVVALQDMLSDAHDTLERVRVALGVAVEPHQSLAERLVEAAESIPHLEADAARYRWLREHDARGLWDFKGAYHDIAVLKRGADLDAAIDEAMEGGKHG